MAKRRKLEAPSAEDLGRIEEEFRRETPARGLAAPIAQVAAESAAAYQPGTAEERAQMARDEVDATAYRRAAEEGLILLEVTLDQIDLASIPRDRMQVDREAMDELEQSIQAHGQRLPIEIYPLSDPGVAKPYGLLSGYRRLLAQQNLQARLPSGGFDRIKAILRDPAEMGGAFVAMVEENEIRQDLSHYERGRIAVIAAQQGAFETTEEAVKEMFAAASKAKRSKIRSFARIFEELGDVLSFPETLREKDGLRLAQALKGGAETRLREVLGAGQGTDAKSEWRILEGVLREFEGQRKVPKKGGRPKAPSDGAARPGGKTLRTKTGVALRYEEDGNGFLIRFRGEGLSAEVMEELVKSIGESLEHI